ncbi:MAG: class I SAM-dependent methyltransferase [bacterium]|nr:class I SAM-dependent methyltransferase [bacterium]
MFTLLPNTVTLAHNFLTRTLKPGDVAVDATVGNGHDTLLLAELVAPTGRIYGFDIQAQALAQAAQLICAHGYQQDLVTFFHQGHEHMAELVLEPVDAVVFNLGYLPGGDHRLVTRPQSTVQAVQGSLKILRPGGIVCLVVYTGHPGGQEELACLEGFLTGIDKTEYCAGQVNYLNRRHAPGLIIIERNQPAPTEGANR